jgi:hypothetical protein
MDTGYPVKLGIVGEKLFEEKRKPNIIIDDFLNTQLNDRQINLIKTNIELFKKI